MRGRFITFEGVEGSGKSTQLGLVAAWMRERGVDCVTTKEPGGTPIGDRIRGILLDPESQGMDAVTEVLLYAASRRQHVAEIVEPALERGAVVLCDRYTDATLAYQGYGRVLELDRLQALNSWATRGIAPDVTLLFDIDEETGLTRARRRNVESALQHEGRFEEEDLKFHRRVREGYLTLAEAEPKRFAIIDAASDVETVFDRTVDVLRKRLPSFAEKKA